jgi:hypothetical protein
MSVPQSTSVTVRDNTVYWENSSFNVTVDEAEAIARAVREEMNKADIDGVLVDNREASGAWPSEVDHVWGELMADIYAQDIPCATLCPSVSNALQIDRLSKDNDTYDRIRGFEPNDESAALEFVDAPSLAV